MATQVIVSYTGSLFLVRRGCPGPPSHVQQRGLATSNSQYRECVKQSRGTQVLAVEMVSQSPEKSSTRAFPSLLTATS